MAFGFDRERGSGRGYVNTSNKDFGTGARLSRRQYDKYVERLGARRPREAKAELSRKIREASQDIRDAERQLRAIEHRLPHLRDNLTSGREAQAQAALILAEQRRDIAASELLGSERSAKGTRRYHAALDAYIDQQKREGVVVSRREAAKSPAFVEIEKLLKGKPNPRGLESISESNKALRDRAFDRLGGVEQFRDSYGKRYGYRVVRPRMSTGQRIRRTNKG